MPLTAANSMPIQTQQVGSSPAPAPGASILTRKRGQKKEDEKPEPAKPATAAIFARRK